MPNRSDIVIEGHLARDAESRTTQNGKEVCSFSVGVTKKYNDNENTNWYDVSIWGKAAEWAKGLKKGDPVHVEGDLEMKTYTKKDGSSGSSLSVTVLFPKGVFFKMGKIGESDSTQPTPPPQGDSDDLPF